MFLLPGEGNGNPLQYSCLENPTDRGARQAMVHRVAGSWTWLKGLSMHARTHACFYCHFLYFVLIFLDLFSSLVFLHYVSCCQAGLVVLNYLNFCLSEKLFISPSIVNEILARYSNLGCRFFPFSTLNTSCHSLLACRVSAERSAVKHMGFLLYVTCWFSHAAFNILSLCLVFISLVNMCLGTFLLGFILFVPLGVDWLFPFPCWGNFQL